MQCVNEYEITIPTDIPQELEDYPPWQVPSIKTEIGLNKFSNYTPPEVFRFRYNAFIGNLLPQHEIITNLNQERTMETTAFTVPSYQKI